MKDLNIHNILIPMSIKDSPVVYDYIIKLSIVSDSKEGAVEKIQNLLQKLLDAEQNIT